MVPVIFGGLFAVIFVANYKSRVARNRKDPLRVTVPQPRVLILDYCSLMLSTLTVTYFMVVRSALTVFDCRTLRGTDRMVLDADPSVYCHEKGSWQVVREARPGPPLASGGGQGTAEGAAPMSLNPRFFCCAAHSGSWVRKGGRGVGEGAHGKLACSPLTLAETCEDGSMRMCCSCHAQPLALVGYGTMHLLFPRLPVSDSSSLIVPDTPSLPHRCSACSLLPTSASSCTCLGTPFSCCACCFGISGPSRTTWCVSVPRHPAVSSVAGLQFVFTVCILASVWCVNSLARVLGPCVPCVCCVCVCVFAHSGARSGLRTPAWHWCWGNCTR